jgi:hypothetical protein
VLSQGHYANQTVTSSALIGSKSGRYFNAAVTVCDESLPFVVAGNTRITGDVYTGPQAISQGRVKGEGIIDEDFLKGTNYILEEIKVPSIDTTVLNQYLNDIDNRQAQPDLTLSGSQVLTKNESKLLNNNSSIYIENNLIFEDFYYKVPDSIKSIKVNGYVEINKSSKLGGLLEISADNIYIRDSAVIDNVILLAQDSILFSDNSFFTGIAISYGNIIVKDKASLGYPSLLLICDNENNFKEDCGITISSKGQLESNCWINFTYSETNPQDYLFYLDTLSIFKGTISCAGKADIRGTVYGSIVTERFHYYLPPTTYINWVKDFYINREYLDYTPVLPIFDNTDSSRYGILREDVL